ncbi:MAG: hypothetical protein EBS13_03640 [Verrucomicrobia bacterium]|nr:hypothetical protein [Verrucomicrobiota bacterium]
MLKKNKSGKVLFLLFWLSPFLCTLALGANPLKETLATIQEKAFNGDAYYQGVLALFHKHGEYGLSVDLEEAERWAKMASEKKGALGLATLAALELERGNVPKGRFLYDEAYLHTNLRKLGNKDDALALFCLGMMEIDNPPANIPKALRHLEESAAGGFASAQATLGMIYFTGIGTPNVQWLRRASQKGSADAALQLRRYENLLARSELPPASYQVPTTQTSFQENITKSISTDLNDKNQSSTVDKVAKNFEEPISFDEEDLIDPKIFDEPEDEAKALLNLGLQNYKIGKFVDAKFYFDKSAAQNNPVAMRHLGILFFLGQGVKIDYKEATKHFDQAKELGDLDSVRYLRILRQFKD